MKLLKRQRGFVAYFDLLGFKRAILANINEACDSLESLRIALEEAKSVAARPPKINQDILAEKYIKHIFFSDSIILFSEGDTHEDLLAINGVATALMMRTFLWRIPIRGGISYGEFFVNNESNLFCGIPIVRAYELSENSQWLGLVFQEIVVDRYQRNPYIVLDDNKPLMLQWDVYLKSGDKKKYWVLNWPIHMQYKKYPPITGSELYQNYKAMFSKEYDLLDDNTKQKYENTAEFVNYTYKKFVNR